ncbi:MAG TPA: ABC transporter transmembrane domain-containing protein [Thermoanaerobaculia bacterium]|nr:ABC transporter transmembrane domain-containing protein [Thermoanaerobaculia bacterium]
MKALRRLYGYLRKYRIWAVVAFGSMIIFALTQTVLVALVQPLFDNVLTPPGAAVTVRHQSERSIAIDRMLHDQAPAVARAKDRFQHWWSGDPSKQSQRVLTVLLLVFMVRAFTSFFSEYAFQKVGLSTVRDLRNELYERMIHQSHNFFTQRSTGELVSRVVSDADAIQAAVSTRMGDLLQESITLLGLIIYLFVLNPVLALVSFVGAPLIVVPVVQFGKKLRRTTHRSQERMAEIATVLEETIRGVRIVKAFTMEPFEVERFREATRRYLRWALRAQRIQALTSPVMELLAGVCMVALFAYAQSRIAAGTLSTGSFISFLTALALMYAPIKKLNKVNLSLNSALSASERVFAMLDIENSVVEPPNAVALQGVGKGIRYDDVTFTYGNDPVLRNVTLDVAPGEIVALVGGSGAGKSTLVNLLPRFYDVTSGSITIDGADVREASLKSLRTLMGLVTQEVILFNDTVRNNIAYGRGDAEQQRVIEAAKAANAHEFISALPQGYDTMIGESGVLLSGGQRQRLAIARALFKDPPILILDEATSALDTESERLVQQALNNLMRGRTTLVIAHRLSTIRSADKIVVLDKGRIVEVGTHEELLSHRGVYRKLYDLQFVDDQVVA